MPRFRRPSIWRKSLVYKAFQLIRRPDLPTRHHEDPKIYLYSYSLHIGPAVNRHCGDRLAQAIAATFQRRKTEIPELADAFSEAFTQDDAKRRQWDAFLVRYLDYCESGPESSHIRTAPPYLVLWVDASMRQTIHFDQGPPHPSKNTDQQLLFLCGDTFHALDVKPVGNPLQRLAGAIALF